MKYLTIQETQFRGPLEDFEERVDVLADALHDLEDVDPGIEDPDLAAHLTRGRVDVQMTVEAEDPAEAATKALTTLRTAVHSIGDATPGWETRRAIMHVAPVDASERMITKVR